MQQGRVAELPPGSQRGVFRTHALPDISFDEQVEMFLDFGVEFQIARSRTEHSTNSLHQIADEAHDNYLWPSNRRTRPMTPEIRSQSSVSRASCFRPCRVM